jgi:CubicO group peptidase (beta-lactamase class C family)
MKAFLLTPFLLVPSLSAEMVPAEISKAIHAGTQAMEAMVEKKEIAGAVIAVSGKSGSAIAPIGQADVASGRAMQSDSLFWIASMSKPITGAAVLLLQDEGKLQINDPVAKFIPEFASLKTPAGQPANLTLTHLLTHTSGLGEGAGPAMQDAKTLADLVPLWLAAPMQFEPGSQWKYCQSSINAAARVVEVVSGMSFDAFLDQRLFKPLGMTDTTFYPSETQLQRLATGYTKDKASGELDPAPARFDLQRRDRPPLGNGGLFSTAPDYLRFCQMLLNEGELYGTRILSPAAVKMLSSVLTGDLPTGFFQNDTFGQYGRHYGWGVGTCVLKTPHPGAPEALSPGSFGHGGAWGTQAWIDPVKQRIYLLMVQRTNFPNGDASEVRRLFQNAASAALN